MDSTLQDMFSEMEETPCVVETQSYLIINPETREIHIPENERIFGVESDEKSERKYFKCPKIVGDNIDLSQLHLYVHYLNAGNKDDKYLIEDVEVVGDDITFSWQLHRKVTKYKGNIKFIISAKKSQSDGTLTNEWNTTLNKEGIVLEGLPIGTPIPNDPDNDIVERLLNMISTKADGLQKEGNFIKLMSGRAELSRVELPNGGGGGQSGEDGATFTPSVSQEGVISWTNDKGKPNPPEVNIKGSKGEPGKSAYEYAKEAGYKGTEQEFAVKLAKDIPDKLPNPNPLTFTGAVNETYDGSVSKTISIPTSGGGSATQIEQFVSPEQFGAKGDGVTDDSNAFKNALLTGKKVICMPKKVYNFIKPVDVRTLYEGHLDLNGSLLKNFHILVNLNDAGNDWRQPYPVGKFVIENGEIGGAWGERPANWEVPVIKTGTQMRLQHLKFVNEPYMLAMVNQYLDYMTFEDCLYIENHALFQGNVLKLDAVNVIGADGNAKRIDGTAQNLAGDAWVFKQCNEWYSPNNKDYKMVAFHNNSNATMMNCVQSGFRLGGSFSDYARVTCISCHWEEAGSMPVLGGDGSTLYLCSALFLGCFFWGNYKLFNFKSVQYINCLFTQTIDNYRLPHIDFAEFTGGKYLHELDCVMQNCGVGGNYIIDTKNIKQTRKSPKKTYNKFMDYLNISNFSAKIMESWEHAKFSQTGQYTYEMYVLATELDNYSYSFKTQQINVTNERTQVTALLGNAVGGFGVRVVRTNPDGTMHESILHSDSEITTDESGNPVARNLVFHDYGEWCDFGFNDDIKTQLPNIWKKISKKPNMIKNMQMLEANGVLVTKDNSKVSTDIEGMIQIQKM